MILINRYPIGRPVGTTIYPGMMITSAAIYHTLNFFGFEISVNDVCVFVPAGFAVFAVTFTYLLTYEITFSANTAIVATGIMAILPAHLMRSVAGGYDNESVAVTVIIATFYFWVRSLRNNSSVCLVHSSLFCFIAQVICLVVDWSLHWS
jgi:dolichyl-diphosphooligosaccharide--protein glycosyltransferase